MHLRALRLCVQDQDLGSTFKIKAGFGVAFAALAGVGIAAVTQIYAWEGSVAWVAHSFEVVGQLNDLSQQMSDLDREQAMLPAQIRERVERLNKTLAEVVRLTGDNPVEQARSRLLQGMARQRVQTAQSFSIVQTMQTEERRLLDTRMAKQRKIASTARSLFELACFLSTVLCVFALWRYSIDSRRFVAAARALAFRAEQYRQVVEYAGDLIFRADPLGRFTFCNPASLTTLLLTEQEVIGRSWLKLIRVDKRRKLSRFYMRQFVARTNNTYCEFPVIDGHGRERWLGQNVQLLLEAGQVTGFQGIAREITERKRAEFELQKNNAFVERIAEAAPGTLYVYDLEERRNVYSNRESVVEKETGSQAAAEAADAAARQFHPDDLPALRSHHDALRYAQDGEIRRIEYRARNAEGQWLWLASRDTPFERSPNGLVKRIVGIAQDITTCGSGQEKVTYQANYDGLTGLANRHYYRTVVQGVLRRSGIEHGSASLGVLNVDRFREVNQRYGISAGDEVLEAISHIMRTELRPGDVTGRLGGDEFSCLLPQAEVNEAQRVAERLQARLGALVFGRKSGTVGFTVTVSVGVAEWRPHMEARDLLEAAELALHRGRASRMDEGATGLAVDAA